MKANIHPTYNTLTATCVCGATYQTGSTVDELNVEVCSSCHPFFTGKQRLLDTSRRVEKFEEKMQKQAAKAEGLVSKKEKKARRAQMKANKAAKIEATDNK